MTTRVPENYERFIVPAIGEPIATDLVRLASLRAGERVLDVGCGTGIVTRLAAQAVTDTGTVVGVDVDPGMLAVAKSVTPSALGIQWREASAETLPLQDEEFDVVLCQMSLQFIPNRLGALREMRRVLAPHGRLVLNVPGPAGPLFATLASAVGRHILPQAAGFVETVFSLHDADELERLLLQAGFRDVAVAEQMKNLELPAADEFLWQYVDGTPLSDLVGQADAAARAAMEREVVASWHKIAGEGDMATQQRLLIARAAR